MFEENVELLLPRIIIMDFARILFNDCLPPAWTRAYNKGMDLFDKFPEMPAEGCFPEPVCFLTQLLHYSPTSIGNNVGV